MFVVCKVFFLPILPLKRAICLIFLNFIFFFKTKSQKFYLLFLTKPNSILDILMSIFVIVSVVGLKDFQNRLQHIFGNYVTLMS